MAKYSKKDYKLMAFVLGKIKDKNNRKQVTSITSKKFAEDNPNFDSRTYENAVEKKSELNSNKRRTTEFVRFSEEEDKKLTNKLG